MFIFQINTGFVSYVDDNIPYCCGRSPEEVTTKLKESSRTIFNWFGNSGVKANPGKFHMFFSKSGSFVANIGKKKCGTKTETLLGVILDN